MLSIRLELLPAARAVRAETHLVYRTKAQQSISACSFLDGDTRAAGTGQLINSTSVGIRVMQPPHETDLTASWLHGLLQPYLYGAHRIWTSNNRSAPASASPSPPPLQKRPSRRLYDDVILNPWRISSLDILSPEIRSRWCLVGTLRYSPTLPSLSNNARTYRLMVRGHRCNLCRSLQHVSARDLSNRALPVSIWIQFLRRGREGSLVARYIKKSCFSFFLSAVLIFLHCKVALTFFRYQRYGALTLFPFQFVISYHYDDAIYRSKNRPLLQCFIYIQGMFGS